MAMTKMEAWESLLADVLADPKRTMKVVVAAIAAADEIHEHLRGRPAAFNAISELLDKALSGGEDASELLEKAVSGRGDNA